MRLGDPRTVPADNPSTADGLTQRWPQSADHQQTRIPCTDGFDRVRSVGIWTAPTRGKVVLVAPPAKTALLTPAQARELRDRLDVLADDVDVEQQVRANRQALYGPAPI